jgi:hypothetical protein
VDVPYNVEKLVEKPYHVENVTAHVNQVSVSIPNVQTRNVEFEVERVVEEPVEIIETEDVPYHVETIVEQPVNVDIHVEIEKVNEVPVYKETVEDVSFRVIVRESTLWRRLLKCRRRSSWTRRLSWRRWSKCQ